jgi:hypothetical protein
MKMEEILRDMKNNYCMDRECCVCYEKFINLQYNDYEEVIEEIKIQYGEEECELFENEFPDWLCFDSRFICLTCKHNDMCYGCLIDLTNENISIYPECEKINIVNCPFCRSETTILPQGLLDDIKKKKEM